MELVAAYRLWFGYRIANYDHRVANILQRYLYRKTYRTHAHHTEMDTLYVRRIIYRLRHIPCYTYSLTRHILLLYAWHLHVLNSSSLRYGMTAVP